VSASLVEVTDLRHAFVLRRDLLGRPRERVWAVDGVSLTVERGETLGVVGESGSGKSTLGRLILRLIAPDDGQVRFEGRDVRAMAGSDLRHLRRETAMVFQDPYASLDPAWSIARAVGEPLQVHRIGTPVERRATVRQLLERVGLGDGFQHRYPYELSGGQRQRVSIARALASRPKFVVCDEPVSALDVSTRAQVLTLLRSLQSELGLAYLFISHDLRVVRAMANRTAVMYLGRMVEVGPAAAVADRPRHPYTAALLSAAPIAHPTRERARERIVLAGDPPSAAHPPSGCHFHPRCPFAMQVCREVAPPLQDGGDGHSVACHLHTDGPRLQGASVLSLLRPDRRAEHAGSVRAPIHA
jgi:oligopeptide/dipeptide ABC transporter ATP-binding protein